ncbi:MAG: hypothetical protein R6U36_02970 [Candidatus Fermentibacteraceae bacterium]
MKRLLVIGSIVLALALMGCDLFGKEDTRIYVWGRIYEDTTFTTPAEGVTVYMRGDSTTVYDQSVMTDATGTWLIEAQVYPDPAGDEGGMGYSMDEYATFGLDAWYKGMFYLWADMETNPITLGIGDTLRIADIALDNFIFGGKSSGGGRSGL